MKKTAILGFLTLFPMLVAFLVGCGQSPAGRFSGQSVLFMKGKALQQPVSLDLTERLYRDYDGSYTLKTSNYMGKLQVVKEAGELQARTLFTYTDTTADETQCHVELTGVLTLVEGVMNGKLCGEDHACGKGSEICIEFKELKKTTQTNNPFGSWDNNKTPNTTNPIRN